MKRCAVALILLASLNRNAHADEEAQIVTTCHYGNAEWGYEMINRCIAENRALRDEILRLGPEHTRAVSRCRERAELGWAWVKQCVLNPAPSPPPLASPQHSR